MARYFYSPFHDDQQDRALRSTRKTYSSEYGVFNRKRHSTWIERGSGQLSQVQPGDKIFLNAHGDQHQPGRIYSHAQFGQGQSRSVSGTANRMIQDGLRDGQAGNPILIKCVICFSGGEVDQQLLDDLSANPTYDLPVEWTARLADGRFAQLLAQALGRRGRNHILVGGYPGALRGWRHRVVTVGVTDGVQVGDRLVHCAWFNTQGLRLN